MAKEAFAREHMQWKVHVELLCTVARKQLKAVASCLHSFEGVKVRIESLTTALSEEYLDAFAQQSIHTARTRLLEEWLALSKASWKSIPELWEWFSSFGT